MNPPKSLTPWAPAMLVALVPLVVLPGAYDRFHVGKWLAVLVLVPTGLAVCAAQGTLAWPRRNWFMGWLAMLVVTTVTGVAPWMSVAGSPNRNAGLIAAIAGTGAFVLGASISSDASAQRIVLRCVFLSGALVGLLAVVELVGVDVVGFGDLGQATRARSTWGSATFAGAHMVIALPIALVHIRSRSVPWRNLAAGSSALIVAGLLATGTRGAWLGALVGAIPLAVARNRDRGEPLKSSPGNRGLLLVGTGIAIAVVVIVAVVPALSRSTSMGRLELWSTAVPVVGDRPLLGSGPDTQRVVLPSGIDASFEANHGSSELHDRAHNIVLDTLVTSGLAGLIAFGAVIVVLGRDVTASAKRQLVPSAIAAGLLGYLVTLLFAFGDPTIDPIAWLLAGLVVGAGRHVQSHQRNSHSEPGTDEPGTEIEAELETGPRVELGEGSTGDSRPVSVLSKRLTVTGLAVVALVGLAWGGGEVRAEYGLERAMNATGEPQISQAPDVLASSSSLAPARFDLDQIRVRLLTQSIMAGQAPGQVDRLVDDAKRSLDRAERIAGPDPDVLMDRAELLTATEDFEASLGLYDRILDLYPNSFRAHLGRGVAAAALNRYQLAETSFELAARLAPKDSRALINLGLLYEHNGRPDDSLRAFKRALKVDPNNSTALSGVSRVASPKGN